MRALASLLAVPMMLLAVSGAHAVDTCEVTLALADPAPGIVALGLDYGQAAGEFPGDSNHPGLGPSWGTAPLRCAAMAAVNEIDIYDDNGGMLSAFLADLDLTIDAGPLFSCVFVLADGFPCPDPSAFTVTSASFPNDPMPPPFPLPPPPVVTISVVPRTPVCGDGFVEGAEECDDGNTFADDCCTDTCVAVAAGASCDDHDACTVGGTCDATATCVPAGPVVCDDGVPCTYDHCDAALGCVADSGPSQHCHPAAASIDIRDAADDSKDALTLQMRLFGHAAGDPTATTDYSVCVFDESSAVPSLAYEMTIPAGSPWQAAGASGNFLYVDPAGSQGGVQQVRLLVKSPSKPGKFQLKAKGTNLVLPPPYDATRFFANDPALTVQLENSDGACWAMEFSGRQAKKNTPARYQAKH